MLADAGAPAVLAFAPFAVMLADAGTPAVLATVPVAVMLADTGAPAVLALGAADGGRAAPRRQAENFRGEKPLLPLKTMNRAREVRAASRFSGLLSA